VQEGANNMPSKRNKPKKPATKQGAARIDSPRGEEFTPHAHLIRIPDKEARLRAIVVLGYVRVPYHGFPDYQYLVENDHIEALKREAIPFEELA
jgi:hypothetical protein